MNIGIRDINYRITLGIKFSGDKDLKTIKLTISINVDEIFNK